MTKSKGKSFCNILNKQHLTLDSIQPLTKTQDDFFKSYDEGKNQVLLGPPGTGKSFLSLFKSFEELQKNNGIKKIILIRSAVQTRDIGFLPGDIKEKTSPYETPYIGILSTLFHRSDAFQILKDNSLIEITLTSFLRGDTFDNTIILVDEFQNLTAHEADSVLTRIGKNSRIVFMGDFNQTDLTNAKEINVYQFVDVLKNMQDHFDFIEFQVEDIVRSDLVKEYIKTKIKLSK